MDSEDADDASRNDNGRTLLYVFERGYCIDIIIYIVFRSYHPEWTLILFTWLEGQSLCLLWG
jgi:hypothetical protein